MRSLNILARTRNLNLKPDPCVSVSIILDDRTPGPDRVDCLGAGAS